MLDGDQFFGRKILDQNLNHREFPPSSFWRGGQGAREICRQKQMRVECMHSTLICFWRQSTFCRKAKGLPEHEVQEDQNDNDDRRADIERAACLEQIRCNNDRLFVILTLAIHVADRHHDQDAE